MSKFTNLSGQLATISRLRAFRACASKTIGSGIIGRAPSARHLAYGISSSAHMRSRSIGGSMRLAASTGSDIQNGASTRTRNARGDRKSVV